MGLIAKIKLLIRGAKPVGEFVNQVKGARLKYKTIPFWVSLLGSGVSVVAALKGFIPGTAAVVITAVLSMFYNILRGLDKMDMVGVRPTLLTTEFWVGTLGIVSSALLQIQGVVDSKVITAAIPFISTAMAIAQQLGTLQPTNPPSPKP